MSQYNISSSTTTNFTGTVPDFIVNQKTLDYTNPVDGETYWYFEEATQHYGYYLNIPEIFSAANALATWAFGRGWTTTDPQMQVILPKITGAGKDTFDEIIWNHQVVKTIVGDSFLEIKRNDRGTLINLIPISPERVRLVFNKQGLIKRYDVWNGMDWKPIQTKNMLHSTNKKIGDQLHGTSQISPAKKIIDARNEALDDERTIKHRDKALGIAYYKTSKTGKISYANQQIEQAVKKGEMVGLPEDTVKIEPYPSRSSEDRQPWIQYLENFFYQIFGVPRSIATSDGTSEVGGINGHLIFEPIYAKEQLNIENDLLQQAIIKVKFNRPPSLAPKAQENQSKNTGQTTIQPGDTSPKLNR
jgi:hypothetical protein